MIEIELPLHKGKPPLTANLRLHWSEEARRTKKIRATAGWAAKAAKLGLCEHVTVQLHYATGDRRRRDADNLVATQKPAIDGLVDAGLIVDDDPQHITWWQPEIHLGPGPRRLWLTVTVTDLSKESA